MQGSITQSIEGLSGTKVSPTWLSAFPSGREEIKSALSEETGMLATPQALQDRAESPLDSHSQPIFPSGPVTTFKSQQGPKSEAK